MEKYGQQFWDERYRQKEFVYGENPNEYLKQKLTGLPPGKILFPAEGEGRNAVFAAKSGWNVSAFDKSNEGKNKAVLFAQKNKVIIDYIHSDVEATSYPEHSFDALVLIYAHFHPDTRNAYHKKLSSYLRQGGILIVEAFAKQQLHLQKENPGAGGPKDPDMLYDLEALKSDFDAFELIEATEATIQLHEGKYHHGPAHVIRIFAMKK